MQGQTKFEAGCEFEAHENEGTIEGILPWLLVL